MKMSKENNQQDNKQETQKDNQHKMYNVDIDTIKIYLQSISYNFITIVLTYSIGLLTIFFTALDKIEDKSKLEILYNTSLIPRVIIFFLISIILTFLLLLIQETSKQAIINMLKAKAEGNISNMFSIPNNFLKLIKSIILRCIGINNMLSIPDNKGKIFLQILIIGFIMGGTVEIACCFLQLF